MLQKQVRLTAFIPPTPCTQEMRDKVAEFAEKEGVSIAHVMRSAIALFFLSSSVENSDINVELSSKEEPA